MTRSERPRLLQRRRIDIKLAPMTRVEHLAWRFGILLAVGVAIALGLFVWYGTDWSHSAKVVCGVAALFMVVGFGADLDVLFESYPKYLERYRALQEESHRAGAAAFRRERQK